MLLKAGSETGVIMKRYIRFTIKYMHILLIFTGSVTSMFFSDDPVVVEAAALIVFASVVALVWSLPINKVPNSQRKYSQTCEIDERLSLIQLRQALKEKQDRLNKEELELLDGSFEKTRLAEEAFKNYYGTDREQSDIANAG